jgi:hypothetical protein
MALAYVYLCGLIPSLLISSITLRAFQKGNDTRRGRQAKPGATTHTDTHT